MPDLFTVDAVDWPTQYRALCRFLELEGQSRSPRGQATRELRNVMFHVRTAPDVGVLPTGVGRGLNLKIAALEALQLCCGIALPELTHQVAPALSPYAEDDGRFWGAYGDRIGGQLVDCYHKLTADPDTRQAVVELWSAELDSPGGKRDHACTLSLTFSIVDGLLEVMVVMRSNDVWLGLPYDLWQFTALQASLANALGMPTGAYTHVVRSLHLYERDVPKVRQLHDHDGAYLEHNGGFSFDRLTADGTDRFTHRNLQAIGQSIVNWPDTGSMMLPPVERWYRERLVGA